MDDFDVLPDMSDADFPYLSDDTLLGGRAEKLLAGTSSDEEPAPDDERTAEVQALRGLLASLRAPARLQELAGEVAALAAFSLAKEKTLLTEKTLVNEKAALKEKGNVRYLPRHFGPKVAAATAVALVAFTGVAAAAVTGALPASVQSFVHARTGLGPALTTHPSKGAGTEPGATTAAGAGAKPSTPSTPSTIPSTRPSDRPTPVPSGSARGVGPAVGGPSTAGLCRSAAASKGQPGSDHSKAARNLQAAAAAAGESVESYCAPYVHGTPTTSGKHGKHGKHSDPTPTASSHGRPPHPSASKSGHKA